MNIESNDIFLSSEGRTCAAKNATKLLFFENSKTPIFSFFIILFDTYLKKILVLRRVPNGKTGFD